jgi:MoxR-like ATPase
MNRDDFVEKRSEVIENILTLYRYAVGTEEDKKLFANDLLRRGKKVVIEKIGDKLLFGPSRFVGYKKNTFEKHTENHGHGTDTTENLNSSMYSEAPPNSFLSEKFNEFLSEIGLCKETLPFFMIPKGLNIEELKKAASCYFISPTHCSGYKGKAWRSFLDNELMAIGWENEDYTNLSVDEIKAIYTGDNPAIQAFSNIKEVAYGDVVCATNNNYGLWGIGVALSSYKYSEQIHNAGVDEAGIECFYSHYVDVAWIDYEKNDDYIKTPELKIAKTEKQWPPYGTLFKPNVFPQYILRYLLKNNTITENNMEIKEYIEILKHKYQIILQGAPGTGKTYMAKKIAKSLTQKEFVKKGKSETITQLDIEECLKTGDVIKSISERKDYIIKKIEDGKVFIGGGDTTSDKPVSFAEIKNGYKDRKWERGKTKKGFDSYISALALQIYNKIGEVFDFESDEEHVKLVQFHPSYSYEDFVRGIEIKTVNGQPEYISKNKIIGEFAEKAFKNWEDSNKSTEEISKEKWLDSCFDKFVEVVDLVADGTISEGNVYKLTDKVNIISVDDDAFRYIGNSWSTGANRMLFKDLKQAYLDGNMTRQEIKRNVNLSGLARQHASYYIRVLENFRKYLTNSNLSHKATIDRKIDLENFVLIIDEINRANLPSVLGELIYALEYRGEKVDSMYTIEGDNSLVLPPNLYIIGTMNTADRSVGQIDYAIRRRFAFVNMLPKVLTDEPDFNVELFKKVSAFFIENVEDYIDAPNAILKKSKWLSDEFSPEDVWIGHSYFIMKDDNCDVRLNYEIKPILREYLKDGILKEWVDGENTKTAIENL